MVGFDYPAMADRATSMKGFAQARFVVVFLLNMAFGAVEFFTLDINEFAGLVVLHMVTDSASVFRKRFGMKLMGKTDLRPS